MICDSPYSNKPSCKVLRNSFFKYKTCTNFCERQDENNISPPEKKVDIIGYYLKKKLFFTHMNLNELFF